MLGVLVGEVDAVGVMVVVPFISGGEVLMVLALLVGTMGSVVVEMMVVVGTVTGVEVLALLALLGAVNVVVLCAREVGVVLITVVLVVVFSLDWGSVEAVVGDAGVGVAAVDVSTGMDVVEDVVVISAVVVGLLLLLVAEVGAVDVLRIVVPGVGGTLVLITTVVPALVGVVGSGSVEEGVGGAGVWVVSVEVSVGVGLAEELCVVLGVVVQCLRSQHSILTW